MLKKLLHFATHQSGLVLMISLALLLGGIYAFQQLPIDAVPDITNVQIQINTSAPGYSPLEVEQRVTFPIESLMSGMPHLKQTRSLSKYGLSQVTVVFEDGTDIYFARQQVGEKLQMARSTLPLGVEPEMGPVSTGLGEIYMWTLQADPKARKADGKPYTPMDLRTLQDWVVRPQLKMVPGITDVNSMGGFPQQYLVQPLPERLLAYGISFEALTQALENNNANAGAGYLEKNGEQYLIRIPGQLNQLADIRQLVISEYQGTPVRLHQVAEVALGTELRTGAATQGGKEVVLGTAVMLIGANSREVSQAVHQKLLAVNRQLPAGVSATPVYNRTELVDKAMHTVEKNLLEGALLVIVILFVFLGNFRAALITALIIPLAMCFTFMGMVKGGVTANLMSLGALDFGILVDGAVVIVENALRQMQARQQQLQHVLSKTERQACVYAASSEASREILFGQLIIMVVYLPILSLTGVEGKMFIPMALTVVMALAGAMLLSFSFVPAAISLLLRGNLQTRENRLLLALKQAYEPLLNRVLGWRKLVLTLTAVFLGLCLALSFWLGSEFIPRLNEGDLVLQPVRIPGTSLSQSVEMQQPLEQALEKAPEVKRVFSRLGTAEIASDPMSPNEVDTFIMLKQRQDWPDPSLSQEQLIAKLESLLKEIPGSVYEFTQPIEMRFNELIAGVRADVAVKIFGDDMQQLASSAQQVASVLSRLEGAADIKIEQVDGLPTLNIQFKDAVLHRYGINKAQVQRLLQTALGGQQVGEMMQGDYRFPLVIRLPERLRQDLAEIERLPVPLPGKSGAFLPLSALARLELVTGPNQISREQGKRRIVVTANVRGTDLGSFVKAAQSELQGLKLPVGYWLDWGGQFQQMLSAARRLQVVIPLALLLILVLLFMAMGNLKDALLIFSGVPLALTGGVIALWLRQMPLSISAGVGFIALSGVAVLNGLVMITFIKHLEEVHVSSLKALTEGALIRLRPVLITALVASLGFVPMALAHGTGAEVQRPLATVVIGGIISSTLLTLVVLPVLYAVFYQLEEVKA